MNTSIKLIESRILVTGMVMNIDKILGNEVLRSISQRLEMKAYIKFIFKTFTKLIKNNLLWNSLV